MKPYTLSYLLAGALACTSLSVAQQPDDTKVNKRDQDRGAQRSTPQNATETKADLETPRKIRRAITSEKTLSTYAHNVKITVKNGVVTLRGPVRTTEEKARIEQLATANGAAPVVNELEIATDAKMMQRSDAL